VRRLAGVLLVVVLVAATILAVLAWSVHTYV
jgi:hypothetical protein